MSGCFINRMAFHKSKAVDGALISCYTLQESAVAARRVWLESIWEGTADVRFKLKECVPDRDISLAEFQWAASVVRSRWDR